MIKLFFGLPGCGKTTLMCYHAMSGLRSKRYSNVYVNTVDLDLPGVIHVTNDQIGKYDISDGLLLIDEGTLFADSRNYSSFPKHQVEFFLLHRHYNVDIFIYTQQWDGIDKKIRVITDRVYYVYKTPLFGKFITRYYRIPYGIIIPDPKKEDSQKLGEIIQGYAKPNFLVRFFSPWIFRPLYYKYFDSWSRPYRPPLLSMSEPYCLPNKEKTVYFLKNNVSLILILLFLLFVLVGLFLYGI